MNETRRQIRRRFGHRTGFKIGARTGQGRVAGAIDRLREFDSENRIALLVAGKN